MSPHQKKNHFAHLSGSGTWGQRSSKELACTWLAAFSFILSLLLEANCLIAMSSNLVAMPSNLLAMASWLKKTIWHCLPHPPLRLLSRPLPFQSLPSCLPSLFSPCSLSCSFCPFSFSYPSPLQGEQNRETALNETMSYRSLHTCGFNVSKNAPPA